MYSCILMILKLFVEFIVERNTTFGSEDEGQLEVSAGHIYIWEFAAFLTYNKILIEIELLV